MATKEEEELERYTGADVDIDSIVKSGEIVPIGEYPRVRLTAIEGKMSKGNPTANPPTEPVPMVQIELEILSGKYEGSSIYDWFRLNVFTVKTGPNKGKRKAPGINKALRAFEAVEDPVPAGFKFPLDMKKAAQLIAKKLGKKELHVEIKENKGSGTRSGEVFREVRIIGLSGKSSSSAAAPEAGATPEEEPPEDLNDLL